MEKFIDLISRRVSHAFEEAGLDGRLGKVTVSNRPDLCEYQCNGAMPAAKAAHRPPLELAQAVAERLQGEAMFSRVEAVKPGFLNLVVQEDALRD